MNEEKLTRYDEKELFEELSKNKDRRRDILINLNVSLQRACSLVANIKNVRELQEYKIAVVSVESELQKIQQENQQLKQKLEQRDNIINKAREYIKIHQQKDEFLDLNEWQTRDLLEILNIDKGE